MLLFVLHFFQCLIDLALLYHNAFLQRFDYKSWRSEHMLECHSKRLKFVNIYDAHIIMCIRKGPTIIAFCKEMIDWVNAITF